MSEMARAKFLLLIFLQINKIKINARQGEPGYNATYNYHRVYFTEKGLVFISGKRGHWAPGCPDYY